MKNLLIIAILLSYCTQSSFADSSSSIATENSNVGDTSWRPDAPGINSQLKVSDPSRGQIQAYILPHDPRESKDPNYHSAPDSVNRNGTIEIKVSVVPKEGSCKSCSQTFDMNIYRLGYYDGAGATLKFSSKAIPASYQGRYIDYPSYELLNPTAVDCPTCKIYTNDRNVTLPNKKNATVGTYRFEAGWSTTLKFKIPNTWISGLYLIKLTENATSFGHEAFVPLIIREDSKKSAILWQIPTATAQAYNYYGGASLYDNFYLCDGVPRVVTPKGGYSKTCAAKSDPTKMIDCYKSTLDCANSKSCYYVHPENNQPKVYDPGSADLSELGRVVYKRTCMNNGNDCSYARNEAEQADICGGDSHNCAYLKKDQSSFFTVNQCINSNNPNQSSNLYCSRGDDICGDNEKCIPVPNKTITSRSCYNVAKTGAFEVSFDRPYMNQHGAGFLWEGWAQTAQFLDEMGYDYAVTTNQAVAMQKSRLRNNSVFLSSGHDEYWPVEEREIVDNAVKQRVDGAHTTIPGISTIILGGNDIYWRVRSGDGPTTSNFKGLVGYKYLSELDPTANLDLSPDLNFSDCEKSWGNILSRNKTVRSVESLRSFVNSNDVFNSCSNDAKKVAGDLMLCLSKSPDNIYYSIPDCLTRIHKTVYLSSYGDVSKLFFDNLQLIVKSSIHTTANYREPPFPNSEQYILGSITDVGKDENRNKTNTHCSTYNSINVSKSFLNLHNLNDLTRNLPNKSDDTLAGLLGDEIDDCFCDSPDSCKIVRCTYCKQYQYKCSADLNKACANVATPQDFANTHLCYPNSDFPRNGDQWKIATLSDTVGKRDDSCDDSKLSVFQTPSVINLRADGGYQFYAGTINWPMGLVDPKIASLYSETESNPSFEKISRFSDVPTRSSTSLRTLTKNILDTMTANTNANNRSSHGIAQEY